MQKTISIAGRNWFHWKGIYQRKLLKDGYKVLISSRNPDRVRDEFKNFEIFKWNPLTEDFPAEIIERSDVVLNLIGEKYLQKMDGRCEEKIEGIADNFNS
jgi:hypothetical protein